MENTLASNIPLRGFFLSLGAILVGILWYFLGALNPVFLFGFVLEIVGLTFLVIAVLNRRALPAEARPDLKFPTKPVVWTIIVLGGLFLLGFWVLGEYAKAFQY